MTRPSVAGGLIWRGSKMHSPVAKGGKAIVAKDANASLVWQSVEHDEMPHDRTPLNDAEKQLLKEWIDSGAEWPTDFIDPAIYAHSGRRNRNWVQRLTVSEYINTVQTTLGVDIAKEARELLPRDVRADGFANTAYNLNVDLKHVDAYAKLANIIVSRFDSYGFAKLYRKKLSLTDDDMRGLIETMGRDILRGPLQDNEVALYRGVSTTVASAGWRREGRNSLRHPSHAAVAPVYLSN